MKPMHPNAIIAIAVLWLVLCLLLPACTTQPKCTPTEVPIYKRAAPPAELSEWQPGRLPLWIPPIDEKALAAIASDPELFNAIIKLIEATSCLTPQGEQEIRDLLLDMKTRIRAWEAWADAPSH